MVEEMMAAVVAGVVEAANTKASYISSCDCWFLDLQERIQRDN